MQRFLVTLVITLVLTATAAWTGVYLSSPPSGPAPEFVIAPGDSADAVARRLKSEGRIRNVTLFKLAIRDSGYAIKFQPGSYDLSGLGSYLEIAERLTTGGLAANEMRIQVIEGWNLSDIKAHLEKIGYAKAADLYSVTGEPARDYRQDKGPLPADPGSWPPSGLRAFPSGLSLRVEDRASNGGASLVEEFDFLADKPDYLSLEGYLFPDTYRVYRDSSAKDLVRTLLGNFGKKMTPELRAAAKANGRSLFEAVTMASIIEREVRGDEDRRMVSDIFWRRFDIGMALQADSTVNYVTGKGLAAVTAEDASVDSRYNTYKFPGLPLGPICNPGLSALKAAVDPKANDHWYFLTDKEGAVHYGKTLDEHNKNKARYLK